MKLGTQHLNAFSKVSDLIWQRTQRASSPSSNNSSLELPLSLDPEAIRDPWLWSRMKVFMPPNQCPFPIFDSTLWISDSGEAAPNPPLSRSYLSQTILGRLPKHLFWVLNVLTVSIKGINIEDLERQMWEVTSRSWKKQDHKWNSIQLKRTMLRMILISGFQDDWLILSHM